MAVFQNYDSIRTATFVKMDVAEYANPDPVYAGALVPTVLAYSDHHSDFVIGSDTYTALGNLVSVSATNKELRSSQSAVTVQISGIPDISVRQIEKSRFKSTPVTIYRAFFDIDGQIIVDPDIDNPMQRFKGFINSYSLTENWDAESRKSTFTISFDCITFVELFSKKKAGRKTNPTSMKRYFPTDISFDRVPVISKANFNFGAQK